MTPAWMAIIGTFIIQGGIAIYVYGKLSQSVSDHGHRLTRIEDEQDDQWTEITRTSNRVAELHGKFK